MAGNAAGDSVLEGFEKDAREAKKGLWADSHPVPSWGGEIVTGVLARCPP